MEPVVGAEYPVLSFSVIILSSMIYFLCILGMLGFINLLPDHTKSIN